jgi:hypothetical protein
LVDAEPLNAEEQAIIDYLEHRSYGRPLTKQEPLRQFLAEHVGEALQAGELFDRFGASASSRARATAPSLGLTSWVRFIRHPPQ